MALMASMPLPIRLITLSVSLHSLPLRRAPMVLTAIPPPRVLRPEQAAAVRAHALGLHALHVVAGRRAADPETSRDLPHRQALLAPQPPCGGAHVLREGRGHAAISSEAPSNANRTRSNSSRS